MKRHVWMSVVIFACAAGFSACGDDDGGDDDPEGGSGGPRAGTTGSSGRGGSGGTSSGGSGSGAGSGAGAGGADPDNPAGCPASAPAEGGDCTMADLECDYGMTECVCDAPMGGGGSGDMMWECSMMGGGNMQMCPASEPTNGGTCTGGRGDCMFGARVCDCNDDDEWACWDPADCPTMPPAEDSACDLLGMECAYDLGGGNEGDCDCEDTGWDCGGDFEEEDGGV